MRIFYSFDKLAEDMILGELPLSMQLLDVSTAPPKYPVAGTNGGTRRRSASKNTALLKPIPLLSLIIESTVFLDSRGLRSRLSKAQSTVLAVSADC